MQAPDPAQAYLPQLGPLSLWVKDETGSWDGGPRGQALSDRQYTGRVAEAGPLVGPG